MVREMYGVSGTWHGGLLKLHIGIAAVQSVVGFYVLLLLQCGSTWSVNTWSINTCSVNTWSLNTYLLTYLLTYSMEQSPS